MGLSNDETLERKLIFIFSKAIYPAIISCFSSDIITGICVRIEMLFLFL